MSDSEDSTVTYTAVSSPFEGLLDIGSPGVDGPPIMPEDPYAYVVAVFRPHHHRIMCLALRSQSRHHFLVPDPVYPEFMPSEDEVFPAEEQPLPAVVSPTTDSPGYIADSDPEEDEEDPEEDPTDYPTDGGDDDDEASDDDEDDDDDDVEEYEDEEEEEEHPTLTPISLPSDTEVARLLAIPTPPPSPLSPLSSPLPLILSPLPQILSPPLPVSSPPLPASPTYPLGYRAAMIRLRGESPSTSHLLPLPSPIVLPHTRESVAMMRVVAPYTYILAPRSGILLSETPPSGTPPLLPISLPTPSTPLLLPSTDCRAGVSEDDMVEDMQETLAATDVAGLSQWMADFITTLRQDTDEIYVRLDDAQDERLLMSDYSASTADGDCRVAGNRPHPIGTTCRDTDTIKDTADTCDRAPESKMAPKRATRSTPAIKTTTTSVTNAQLKALIDQGVANVLATRDADRSMNGDVNHNSGTGVRRQAPLARECTYPDFMKCKPLYFKGTKGVIELTQWFERMETVFRISNCSV
ncbi:hypothetical protein Tco_0390863 [Tanacetum coccineum]